MAKKEEVVGITPKKCYYEVLGVDKRVGAEEIKRAYRTLAMKYHPDKINRNDEVNIADDEVKEEYLTMKFQQLQNAYDILSSPSLRSAYDDNRRYYEQESGFSPKKGGAASSARPPSSAYSYCYPYDYVPQQPPYGDSSDDDEYGDKEKKEQRMPKKKKSSTQEEVYEFIKRELKRTSSKRRYKRGYHPYYACPKARRAADSAKKPSSAN